MSAKTIGLSEELHAYLVSVGLRETDVQRELRKVTAEHPKSNMQISPEQGAFMQSLIRLSGAKLCLEIGTFTGYSALSMAQALPAEGQVICCDISEEFVAVGRPFWKKAGVDSMIHVHIGPALDTLNGLEGPFDIAFIDADKENYRAYYEACLELVRPGGLILIDNTLWSGQVAYPEFDDPETIAIRELNAFIHSDPRVFPTLVPIGDGLTLAVKSPGI
jgi:predicted O-methyltransferase YrrM